MTNKADTCPNTDNGKHRYFIFKTFEIYEPVTTKLFDNGGFEQGRKFYEKQEYALLGCNCSSVIRVAVT